MALWSKLVTLLRAEIDRPTAGASGYLEVFDRSCPGQKLIVSGLGILTTARKGGAVYYAKIDVPADSPVTINLTDESDGSIWVVADVILTVEASSSDSFRHGGALGKLSG
jgi:hypothetical protein